MMLLERERTGDPVNLDPVNEPDAGRTVQDDDDSWAVVPSLPMSVLDGVSDELRAEIEEASNVVDFPEKRTK